VVGLAIAEVVTLMDTRVKTIQKMAIMKTIFTLLLLMVTLQIVAQQSTDQSTTGPVPPKGVDIVGHISSGKNITAQYIISGVPAYKWWRGCGPTALGMICGYYDAHGFPDLIPGDASTQTADVDSVIASTKNYNDYCLPLDAYPNLLPDKSELPLGDEHINNCIADYMFTSQSRLGNYYGWGWGSHVRQGWQKYILNHAPNYAGISYSYSFSAFPWDSLVSYIDRNSPLIFLVDTDGNGSTDHFVCINGYKTDQGINYYGCLNTWDLNQHWYTYSQMGDIPWGISTIYTFAIHNLPAAAGTITGMTTVCQGQSSVTYTVPPVANATSCIWTLPAGATGTSTTNSITVNYSPIAISGSITVKGSNPFGSGVPSSLQVTVKPMPPTPFITVNGEILHSDATNGNQWYDVSGMINGATSQDYTATSNNDYYVIVTAAGCKSDTSNILNVLITGVEVKESNREIKVYPNPVSDELTIEMPGNINITNFEIFNSLGQVVYKGIITEKTIVQTDNFPPGFYLIKLGNLKTFKFIQAIKK
jgi:hypothetical protein